MDSKIKATAKQALNEGDDALSDDELFAELENDPELEMFRESRLNQLKHEISRVRDLRSRGHGEYTEVQKEEDMVRLIASASKGVVHFKHPQFARCKILDTHLQLLARYHFDTRFATMSVEKCPFLAQKFQVRVLPCVLVIQNGSVVDRIVGFEELGNADNFATEVLEKRLAQTKVIQLPKGELASIPVKERPVEFQVGGSDSHDEDDDDSNLRY
ncbi:hypothetical protein GGH12_004388 [Coemansia sp. RSA 1822]|nr:hypothetical protein LPJ76_005440 [Coemansia sp. RSA 638]KAJ2123435.1 hypothetical protein IW147_002648 [Coemansia sp. RSA 720]KAJ2476373.1 hypothetical protein IWW56_004954 [Coemansia sp. RSA 2131]KAJ2542209.1 hypothetical protein GGF49_003093 [Coemansia sp. RSA 1853]KAJ2560930.1 hypothetical protein GGH12_004388 [Coemansia sp. RSA 1822]